MQALLDKDGFDDDIDNYIKQPTVSTVINDDGDEAEVHVFCIEPEVDQIKESVTSWYDVMIAHSRHYRHPRAAQFPFPLLYSYPAYPHPILTASIQKTQTENRNSQIQ